MQYVGKLHWVTSSLRSVNRPLALQDCLYLMMMMMILSLFTVHECNEVHEITAGIQATKLRNPGLLL